MVMVCVHHPLNPEKSKMCMKLVGHRPNWIANLELPFLNDKNVFDHALINLTAEDLVDREEGLEAFEKAKREREELIKRIDEKEAQRVLADEGMRFIPMKEPTLSDLGGRSVRKNLLDLNDPRIAEINIKYRD